MPLPGGSWRTLDDLAIAVALIEPAVVPVGPPTVVDSWLDSFRVVFLKLTDYSVNICFFSFPSTWLCEKRKEMLCKEKVLSFWVRLCVWEERKKEKERQKRQR